MLAEVAAVIAAVKGINDAISAVKTAGGHATDLGTIVQKYATANEKLQEAESKHVGKLSLQDSMQMQVAKKQLQTFNQQLKDMMLMQGLASDYNEIMNRVEESRIQHEKELAKIKRKKAERRKLYRELGQLIGIGFCCLLVCFAGLYLFLLLR